MKRSKLRYRIYSLKRKGALGHRMEPRPVLKEMNSLKEKPKLNGVEDWCPHGDTLPSHASNLGKGIKEFRAICGGMCL